MSVARLGSTLFAALAVCAAPVRAQSNDLDRVQDLARMGRTEEARTALQDWWGKGRSDASREDLQLGLWLRGRLTVDPSQADLDYQRLVVLYPNGTYAPQALFRLAQSAYARGDTAAAQRQVASLARDYPSSQTRRDAEAWLRSAGPPRPTKSAQAAEAARPAGGGALAAGAAPDTAIGGIRASAGRQPAPADQPLDWSVQFGAFADEARAVALDQELVQAGLAARLVRVQGSSFLHVRIGRFATREEANTQLEQVQQRGFTASIVKDDRAEEVVRR
jgi:cell division septation protein DedD